MKVLQFSLLLLAISSTATAAPTMNVQKYLPKEVCDSVGIQTCNVKNVDSFSEVDLNNDGEKEIIFAYDGGSCGEQHYIYTRTRKDKKWVEIANWCGMDGGAYKVLSSKHNGYFDIDTYVGVIRFDGKKYADTTSK